MATESVTISKDALAALAGVTLSHIHCDETGDLCESDDVEETLCDVLLQRYALAGGRDLTAADSKRIWPILSTASSGFYLGLGVAAAVATHGLNLDAAKKAVLKELKCFEEHSTIPENIKATLNKKAAA